MSFEPPEVERKRVLDMHDAGHKLKLVAEVVAMHNSGGGTILIGVEDDGRRVGISVDTSEAFDPADVSNLVEAYIRPDRIELSVDRDALPDGSVVVAIAVPACLEPPVLIAREGSYARPNGKQEIVLRPGRVLVRRGTRVVDANREDFRRWTNTAVTRERDAILDRLTMVVEAPADAEVRVVTSDTVLDPPAFLLSRLSSLFEVRSDHLLTGDDLLYLWSNRDRLEINAVAKELLVQSALRKRATLLLWLYWLRPTAEEISSYLERALEMSDRDKSDAARSILQVAALSLTEAQYETVRSAMAGSGYAHMREAAGRWDTSSACRDDLLAATDESLSGVSVSELLAEADRVAREGTGVGTSRTLTKVGLALLATTSTM